MFQHTVRSGLLILALSGSAGIAAAQSTIHICGTGLRIGMAKDRVQEIMRGGCEVKRYSSSGLAETVARLVPLSSSFDLSSYELWCARPTEKMNSGLAVYEGCNHIHFYDGAIAIVERYISEAQDETSADLMSGVYAFIREAAAGGQSVIVSVMEYEYEKRRFRTIKFTVGDRSMDLIIFQPIGSSREQSSIRLYESLRRPESRPRKQ